MFASPSPSFISGITENNREQTQKRLREKEERRERQREGGRDDAVRAIIDVRTTWMGARHLRPFSLLVPALTACHRHH